MRYSDISQDDNIIIQNIKKSKWYDYDNFFVRGSNASEKNIFIIQIDNTRNREPRDVSLQIHDLINNESEEKFGYKIRNGLFLHTNNVAFSEFHYGTPRIILPFDDATIFSNGDYLDLYGDMSYTDLKNFDDDSAKRYVGDTYIVKAENIKEGSIMSECMAFGKFYSISLEFAKEYDLFKLDGTTHINASKSNSDVDTLVKMRDSSTIITKNDIIHYANMSFDGDNKTELLKNWVYVLQLHKLHTHKIVENRLLGETTKNIAAIFYMANDIYLAILLKHFFIKDREKFIKFFSDNYLKGIVIRKLTSMSKYSKIFGEELTDILKEIYGIYYR
jgi:hypothetical protein